MKHFIPTSLLFSLMFFGSRDEKSLAKELTDIKFRLQLKSEVNHDLHVISCVEFVSFKNSCHGI